MATVSFHGLTKKFTGMAAVDDLRLEIKDGEFVSLLGPSGCGKTTTLRLVAGFLQPDAGEIRVDDKIISSLRLLVPPERRNMSMIFQSYAIWPHMTVFQNVAYGLKFKKLAGREIDEKTERLLRVVHLEALKARYPAELSGGQQQRVALARALVVEPQILLLDEPLSNLDANLREEMRFEIRRLHEEFGITTIYVTHDQAEAMVTFGSHRCPEQGANGASWHTERNIRSTANTVRGGVYRQNKYSIRSTAGRECRIVGTRSPDQSRRWFPFNCIGRDVRLYSTPQFSSNRRRVRGPSTGEQGV